MTVLEIVSTKLNNPAITEPNKQLAIEEVAQAIKNYCNISEIPEALKYTWANMSVDLAKYSYELTVSNDDVLNADASDVSSIKIGDTQIQLQGNGSERAKALKSHRPNLDAIVMNYKDQLNKFRRMVW